MKLLGDLWQYKYTRVKWQQKVFHMLLQDSENTDFWMIGVEAHVYFCLLVAIFFWLQSDE